MLEIPIPMIAKPKHRLVLSTTYLLWILPLIIISCANKDERLRRKIGGIVKDEVLRSGKIDSSVVALDEFTLHKVDTLTDKIDSTRLLNYLVTMYNLQSDAIETKIEMARLDQSSAKLKLDNARLYRSMWGNDILTKMELEDAQKYLDNAKSISEEVKKETEYLDRNVKSRIDTINIRLDRGEVDSTTFRGYIAVYSYRGADMNNKEVRADSLQITISEDFRVMPWIRANVEAINFK